MVDRTIYNKAYYQANKEKSYEHCKAWRLAHAAEVKAKLFARNLRVKFNLTVEEYNQILKNQNNACPICGLPTSFLSRNLSVDHDHKTGKIRGLLCENCNVGLGHFKDNPNSLRMAIVYLEKQSGR
jgi:hypothetical protein